MWVEDPPSCIFELCLTINVKFNDNVKCGSEPYPSQGERVHSQDKEGFTLKLYDDKETKREKLLHYKMNSSIFFYEDGTLICIMYYKSQLQQRSVRLK